jgi:hypothetical protein
MSGILNYNPEIHPDKDLKVNARAIQQGIVDAGINRREFRTFVCNGATPGFEGNRHEFTGMLANQQLFFGCERPAAWIDGFLTTTVHYSGDIAVAATRYKDGDAMGGIGEGQVAVTETMPGVTAAKAKLSFTFAGRLAVLKDSNYLAWVFTRSAAGDTYAGGVLRVLSIVITYQPNRRTG